MLDIFSLKFNFFIIKIINFSLESYFIFKIHWFDHSYHQNIKISRKLLIIFIITLFLGASFGDSWSRDKGHPLSTEIFLQRFVRVFSSSPFHGLFLFKREHFLLDFFPSKYLLYTYFIDLVLSALHLHFSFFRFDQFLQAYSLSCSHNFLGGLCK